MAVEGQLPPGPLSWEALPLLSVPSSKLSSSQSILFERKVCVGAWCHPSAVTQGEQSGRHCDFPLPLGLHTPATGQNVEGAVLRGVTGVAVAV